MMSIGIQKVTRSVLWASMRTGKSTLLRNDYRRDECRIPAILSAESAEPVAWLPQMREVPENATILSYAGDDDIDGRFRAT